MSRLVIEIDTPEDAALLISILPEFNARVEEATESTQSASLPPKTLAQALEAAAMQGGLPSFGDASEWQRDSRSWDRKLDGRDE